MLKRRGIGGALAGVIMAIGGAYSVSAFGADDEAQTIREMERHWQKVIREEDPAQRRQLMAEHRRIMEDLRADYGGRSGGHHGHMRHSVDMHDMMMDMMHR